ncbi:carboxylesterase from carbohydrate esterase [Trametes versicolor FP-101664 SS1]|uniref:carboxylesterase from carbohydrate esterase n=1 Tax=Trametes versicolor (strain FP-101664) TaxID=717944 RepID=UPI000462142E|nr:carboxylesterase from carbohydrate esterase [Trametes versicolor FP-101664 SS1]EIW55220.1 carboxylesterase from carbohydrate esterase [Trametes versicolor FP-101664 SS1]
MQPLFAFASLALAGLLATPLVCAAAVPSLASLGSDISLLYNNDLDVFTAPTHRSALLLSAPRFQRDAASACSALGETLLPVNKTFFKNDLVPSLQYQVFQRNFPSNQQFWVANEGRVCQVVNAQGVVSSSLTCLRALPALCSQSAGFRAAAAAESSLTVHSQDLTVTGFRDQTSFKFFGIPYANPPVRFEYPTAYTGNKTIDARNFRSQCIQAGTTTGSEDCLFLNIWTPFIPSPASRTPLKAVMFWIHGGAFTGGTGSDSTFEGSSLASRGDVVLVTINYRLSTLGFLALDDGKTNGNFGIADQIVALEWVHEHIAAFGGDKDRITIFGQSAGAASVRALMGSPKAIGKYAAAVPMSNLAGANYATTYSLYYTIPQEVSLVANPILAAVGCNASGTDALACMRAADPHTLVSLPTVARFLVVDGTFITSKQLPLDRSGPIANVHTMMGFMRDDGAAFIGFPANGNLTAGLLGASLNTTVVNNPLFPEPSGQNATLNVFNVTAGVTTDVEFRCLDQATAFSGVSHNLFKNVWFYEFNRSYQTPGFSPNFPVCEAPITADSPFGDTSQEYFKCHSGELYYVFGSLPESLPYRDAQDLPFMQRMVDIWSSFARTFDPNPDPRFLAARGFTGTAQQLARESRWEPVTKASLHGAPVRELQWDSVMTPFGSQAQCQFLGFPLTFYG